MMDVDGARPVERQRDPRLYVGKIERVYEEERGQPPCYPVMMTKVRVHADGRGVVSSRQIQRRLAVDVVFRVLRSEAARPL